jgi:hypothetical protein
MQLNEKEKLALVGLMRFVVRLDGHASPEEMATVAKTLREVYAPQVGEGGDAAARIAALEERADRELKDDDAIRRVAMQITRPEAREAIFAAVADLAAVDGINMQEGWLLDWLANEWELKIEDATEV